MDSCRVLAGWEGKKNVLGQSSIAWYNYHTLHGELVQITALTVGSSFLSLKATHTESHVCLDKPLIQTGINHRAYNQQFDKYQADLPEQLDAAFAPSAPCRGDCSSWPANPSPNTPKQPVRCGQIAINFFV